PSAVFAGSGALAKRSGPNRPSSLRARSVEHSLRARSVERRTRGKEGTMRRITTVLAATACLAGLAQPAYGTATTGSFEQEITYVDEGASAACGFTVTFHQLDRGTYQLFFDQQGDLTRIQVQTLVNGTATANGITLLVHGRENNFYDLV